MDLPLLVLKKGEERRLRAGHLWVYGNEVDAGETPLHSFAPGQPVVVRAKAGTLLGTAYVNPHTLICARLVSGDPEEPFARPLIVRRLQQALGLRERLFRDPYYRLVYGEGDFLPGLIVDRYGGMLVVQFNTAGMERAEAEVIDALMEVVAPEVILLRNDSPARRIEGLDTHVRTACGVVPEEVALTEYGARFEVPIACGQKTGWYYDHRENRERMLRYAGGARVLDAFSYLGAWGIEAAVAGAERVVCIESSPIAAASIARHAAINQVADRVEVVQADVFDTLKSFDRSGVRFDLVVLDPPAFIKRRKDLEEGSLAYRRLNLLAMTLLSAGGTLVSASCSSHLAPEQFVDALRRAARRLDRDLQVIAQGHQSPDHPVHPAIPETNYLKTLFCRVL
ncbi:MAG: class I SAM-dependent rRNA methyltransferase [Pseudomonadota bacterium]|nr:class I SAM-dependent rRNA methyltransferase [Pseudomonadota bacterium]